ncbi:MAG: hypothetical protein ACKPKO_33530, partial [Candidatus Fonsibacter sp.]
MYISDGEVTSHPFGDWIYLQRNTFKKGDLVLLPAGYAAIWNMEGCFALLWREGHVAVPRDTPLAPLPRVLFANGEGGYDGAAVASVDQSGSSLSAGNADVAGAASAARD